MMPKVSIITPVYNAEKYLYKAIDNIIAQTLTDWELILVNDGSTDNSSQICDEYAAKDTRIKVIHKANEGVAVARQTGIDHATGKYSIHADADDWMEYNALEALYRKAETENADVVIADFFTTNNGKDLYCKQYPSELNSKIIVYDLLNNKLFGSLWNKLIRLELYKHYNLHFYKGIDHCEDLLICIQLMQNENIKITYLPKAFYHYCMYPDSITHHFTRETYNIRIKFRDKLKDLLSLPNANEIIDKVSFNIFTEAYIYNILTEAEIQEGLTRYKKQIKQIKSPKWKLGFHLLSLGFTNAAHKLIRY